MIRFASNDELARREQETALPAMPAVPQLTGLTSHMSKMWEKAKTYNQPFHDQQIDNMRAYNSEYSPRQLAEIRELGGSEIYIALTTTKCNAMKSWLVDLTFGQSEAPYGVEPTPIPELEPQIEETIKQRVMMDAMQTLSTYAAMTGQNLATLVMEYSDAVTENVVKEMVASAKDSIDAMKKKMDDQFAEGGWKKAMMACIHDLVVMKAAVIKGPVNKRVKYFRRQYNQMTGKFDSTVTEKIIPTWERVDPMNVYPMPGVTDFDDGDVFILSYITPKTLTSLRGVPRYNTQAIDKVLTEMQFGTLRKEWASRSSEAATAQTGSPTSYLESDRYELVEFHGSMIGAKLLELEAKDMLNVVVDPMESYDVSLYWVGTELIWAVVNPDPMGRKPLGKACYMERPGSFWGDGLPELIGDLQKGCNAMGRAIINNAGLSSGPLTEINRDRLEDASIYDMAVYPWKQIFTNDAAMTGAPAVRFYQPQMVADALLRVFDHFSRLADNYSIPSYAHGDAQVAGAGGTASGLSMLMQSANRIVKNVVVNLDGLITTNADGLYNYNMYFEDVQGFRIGDVKIVAKGSAVLMQKETQAVRRNEFLNTVSNPEDRALLGNEARIHLLKEVAEPLDFRHPDKIFPATDKLSDLKKEMQMMLEAQAQQAMQAQAMQPGAPQSMDAAGNPRQGQMTRTINQGQAMQSRPDLGRNR